MKYFYIYAILFVAILSGLKAQTNQATQSINYQAVVRNNLGNILANQPISLRLSILDSSINGNILYVETFSTTTNQFGLFTVNIGTGTVVFGSFSTLNWANASKWLKVEIDENGGNNFVFMGTTQFLSVPYALYAEKSGFSFTQNTISPIGDTVFIGNSFIIIPGASMANACRSDFVDYGNYTQNYTHAGDFPYNSELYGLPKFILKNYIELDKIDSISRFRSGVGHDYSDSFEACRSLKHYFKPKRNEDWSLVKIFSPVNGVVSNSFPETIGGNQVSITPFGMPAFNVIIFHVNLTTPLNIGDTVWSGQQIGMHTGPQTTSDIAIQIITPNNTFQRASYFEVMTDKLFSCYMSKGVISRDALIITKIERDADPLMPCNGQQFFYQGTINNWVTIY